MNRQIKVLVEKHEDGYVAYPFGLKVTAYSDDVVQTDRHTALASGL